MERPPSFFASPAILAEMAASETQPGGWLALFRGWFADDWNDSAGVGFVSGLVRGRYQTVRVRSQRPRRRLRHGRPRPVAQPSPGKPSSRGCTVRTRFSEHLGEHAGRDEENENPGRHGACECYPESAANATRGAGSKCNPMASRWIRQCPGVHRVRDRFHEDVRRGLQWPNGRAGEGAGIRSRPA